ncbi:MAG: hypothetical protein E7603_00815 [Ruminococcaceae bacterium]|nr:hypothetical protein [Oscillospiraceae bacterium]
MNKRQRKKQERKQDEREWQEYFDSLKKLPAWYWKRGIHDAKILDVWELENGVDKKRGKYYRNCLVLSLDSSGAIYDINVEKIIFYNYEVKKADVSVSELSKTWWMGDTIEQLSNGNYFLNFEVDPENHEKWHFSIEFEYADVERRDPPRMFV